MARQTPAARGALQCCRPGFVRPAGVDQPVRVAQHRQTAAVWCRKERFLRPEELLIWSRLLLVAVLLEQTDLPAGTIAQDLDFPSAVSLRNQLKRYTGLTALEIRDAGLEAVLAVFDREVERARGMAQEPASARDRRPRTVARSH